MMAEFLQVSLYLGLAKKIQILYSSPCYMKKDIHPQYNHNVKVTCSCGNTFTTGSTAENLSIEICSNCHPFYTGKSKVLDTQGRVERFKRMVEKKISMPTTKSKKVKKEATKQKKTAEKKSEK